MARYFTKDEKKFMRERELRDAKAGEEDSQKNFYRDAHDYKGLNQARYRIARETRSGERQGDKTGNSRDTLDYETRRPPPDRRYSERGRSGRRHFEDSSSDIDESSHPGRYEHRHTKRERDREPGYDREQPKSRYRGRPRERAYAHEVVEEREGDDDGDGRDRGNIRPPPQKTSNRKMHKSIRRPKSPDQSIPGSFHYYSDNSEGSEREHPSRRPRRPKQDRAYSDGYQRRKPSSWF